MQDQTIITVFGGSGFLGRHIVQRLAQAGALVRIACRHPGEARHLQPAGAVGQIFPMAIDIRDDASVAVAVQGADAVINLVGILYETPRWSFQAVHADAAGRIARAAAAAGATRLIQVSAIGADERSPAAYARTKAAGERAVREAFPAATILRPSIVFGPEDNFFNQFASMARIAPALPLIGGGETRFQPVYVEDVAAAVLAVLEDSATAGQTYELGGPQAYSFRTLLEYILEQTGRRRCLVTLPWKLATLQAALFEWLPKPPLTRDQVEMLKRDNVVQAGMPGLKELGITPTALEAVVPAYLARFRSGGR